MSRRRRARIAPLLLPALLAASLAPASGADARETAGERLRIGAWVPNWDQDDASRRLHRNRTLIGSSSPVWFGAAAGGEVEALPGALDPAVADRLRATADELIPLIAGPLSAPEATRTLGRRQPRREHVRRIVRVSRGFDGVDLNYEEPAVVDSGREGARAVRRALSSFFRRACAALQRRDRLCVVTVMPRTSARRRLWRDELAPWVYDYELIGRAADRVRVMAYDQHARGTGPGPIGGLPWVERVTRFARRRVPARKLELGIPLYGRDWTRGTAEAEDATWAQLEHRRSEAGARRRWSRRQAAPWFRYRGREVHYSDARSVAMRARLARRLGLGGVHLWAPGEEDPRTWARLGELGDGGS